MDLIDSNIYSINLIQFTKKSKLNYLLIYQQFLFMEKL